MVTTFGFSVRIAIVTADYEQVAVTGQFVFWSAPVKTHGRTRWATIVKNKALYQWITIRNANTARKLAALAQD